MTSTETAAVTARTERRLPAILAADIVGYSRLVEQDEAGTLAAIRGLRASAIDPLLAEHKGRIVKLMGDGALVEFASVVDAVACAVAIQQAVADRQAETPPERRLVFRIGINLGDVVVDGEDLLGDGVNVAARLEQLCEPGGVLVSGTAFDHLQGRLGLPLEFTGEQQVKNIARPVRAYRVRLDGGAGGRRAGWAPSQRAQRFALGAAALLFAAIFAGGVWWLWPAEPAPGKPAIAVLPFDSYGGDAAAGRLADGITEDIVTNPARFRSLDVIARNSTEVYKDKPADVRQIGKELDVEYVIEGSIQRSGDRVRVTAQLIDATTGTHVWTDRWDRPPGDVFAVQTEVVERTVNSLQGVMQADALAAAKRRRATDLGAYDDVLLGGTSITGNPEPIIQEALSHCESAIAKDPSFAAAYICKAWRLWQLAQYRQNYDEAYAEMDRLARRAVELDPYDAMGYTTLAFALSSLGRNAEAQAATERALELAPSYADILNMAADNMPFYGMPERGAELCDHSFRLNPNAPSWYNVN